MSDLQTVDELIDACGGTSVVAAKLGVLPGAVSNWRARGIVPAEYFMAFSTEAETLGRRVDPSLFRFAEARA